MAHHNRPGPSTNSHSSNDSLFKKKSMDWSQFYKNLPPISSSDEDDETDGSQKERLRSNVMRLKRTDMALYGLCPETDQFMAVVCDYCNAVIKPQGLRSHYINRHNFNSKEMATSIKSLPSTGSNFTPDSQSNNSMAPPMYLLSSTTSSNTSTLLNVDVISGKSKQSSNTIGGSSSGSNSKFRRGSNNNNGSSGSSLLLNKLNSTSGNGQSTTSSISYSVGVGGNGKSDRLSDMQFGNSSNSQFQQETDSSNVDLLMRHSKKRQSSSHKPSPTPTPPLVLTAVSPTVSGLSTSTRKCIPIKDREYSPDTHCGVLTGDPPKPCTRSLTCKSHALSLRRMVVGRTKPFDKLLTEHRQNKLASTTGSSRSSSGGGTAYTSSSLGRNFETDSESSNSNSSMPPTVSSSSSTTSIENTTIQPPNVMHFDDDPTPQPQIVFDGGDYDMDVSQSTPTSTYNLPPLPPLASVWSNNTKMLEDDDVVIVSLVPQQQLPKVSNTPSTVVPKVSPTPPLIIPATTKSAQQPHIGDSQVIKNQLTPPSSPAAPTTNFDLTLCVNCHGYTYGASTTPNRLLTLSNCSKCRRCMVSHSSAMRFKMIPCCHGISHLKSHLSNQKSDCGAYTKIMFIDCRWCGRRFGVPGCPVSTARPPAQTTADSEESNWTIFSRPFSDLTTLDRFELYNEYRDCIKTKIAHNQHKITDELITNQFSVMDELVKTTNLQRPPVQMFMQRIFLIKCTANAVETLRIHLELIISMMVAEDPSGRLLSFRLIVTHPIGCLSVQLNIFACGFVMADEHTDQIPSHFTDACLRILQPLIVFVELRTLFSDEKNRPENWSVGQLKNFNRIFVKMVEISRDHGDLSTALAQVRDRPNFREFNSEISNVKNIRTAAVLRAIYFLNVFNAIVQEQLRNNGNIGIMPSKEDDFNAYFLNKSVANDDLNFGLCEIDETSAGIKDKLNELLDEFFAGHENPTATVNRTPPPLTVAQPTAHPAETDEYDDDCDSSGDNDGDCDKTNISIYDEIKMSSTISGPAQSNITFYDTTTNGGKSLFFLNSNNSSSNNSRRRDFPGIKKWYRSLSKPIAINTFMMIKAGGGHVFKRKLTSVRRTVNVTCTQDGQNVVNTPMQQQSQLGSSIQNITTNTSNNYRMFVNSSSSNYNTTTNNSYEQYLNTNVGSGSNNLNDNGSPGYVNKSHTNRQGGGGNNLFVFGANKSESTVDRSANNLLRIRRLNSMKKKIMRTALLSPIATNNSNRPQTMGTRK